MLLLVFDKTYTNSATNNFGVSQLIVLFGGVAGDVGRLVRPETAASVDFRNGAASDRAVGNVLVCLTICYLYFVVVFFLLLFRPFSVRAGLSTTTSYFGGVNPNLSTINPTTGFGRCSCFTGLILSTTVLLKHLRVLPVLILFSPSI